MKPFTVGMSALRLVVVATLAAACTNGSPSFSPSGPATTVGTPTASTSPTSSASTPPGSPSPATSPRTSTPLCSNSNMQAGVESSSGAAGSVFTVWFAKNVSAQPCHSFAYPGMDFHASSGWLDVHVHQSSSSTFGGPPAAIVVQPGASLYFLSSWSDVGTASGPCTSFDEVKVTLPDNFVSLVVHRSGCVDAGDVTVGPVRSTPLSP